MMNLKDNKGLTLVMLIITILVMFILAGIAISMATGNDGVIKRAEDAVDSNNLEEDEEELGMNVIKILEKKSIITLDDLKGKLELLGWTIDEVDDKFECTSPNNNKITIDKYGEIQ